MRRYSSKKNYQWTAPLAYVAGLIAADGCLQNDGRHLNLTSMDIDLLNKVRSILLLKCSIARKKNGYGGYGYYIQFSDVALYDFLKQAGITPAKSKTIAKVDVPNKFYRDFLRGLFDGDGCVYGFWDKRWRNSLMYYTEFASASQLFLNWLHLKNIELAGVTRGRIKPGTRVSSLSYAKQDSRKLFRFMYYNSALHRLDRKYLKFVDFIRLDPYANRELGEWRNPVDALD